MNFLDNKRYYTLNQYLKNKYNSKVFKVSLNAGFTCPNIDGKKGYGGCTYCSSLKSGDFAGDKQDPLRRQFDSVRDMLHSKWPDALYIPYFQAGTNTYSDISTLRRLFDESLTLDENIVGLAISTRPDALNEDIYEYLSELNNKTDLWVELGLQTIKEETSVAINRGHSLKEFEDALNELHRRNINVVVHIINGLPGETKEDMINTVKYLADKNIFGIKIHLLHVMKNTVMGNQFLENPFKILSLEEYVDIVCDQLELLPSNVILHRITGDAPKDLLIEPQWSLKKFVVMNEIDKEMVRRNAYQGDKCK